MELNSPYPQMYDDGESSDLLGTSFVAGGGKNVVSDRVVHLLWKNCSCCSSSSDHALFLISEISFVSTSSSFRPVTPPSRPPLVHSQSGPSLNTPRCRDERLKDGSSMPCP
uniref:Uncharacterized protein n=1 Tax=Sexangularia sp. CB-2014 TaxID=1486929 RepID=A0A7S1VCZ7_9EUKA|mmetsp:Transcript_16383/g.51253  ORF Transcript_16383/g.51253 Transcript_16383/m.51253 type:complete len:111 (+) Transcript_16383:110-442(+)